MSHECICGLDDSPNGLRTDIVCPKHDGVFKVPGPSDTPRTEAGRQTAHTFEQINWEYAEQETRIGVLQEMVAILLNRLDEREAAATPPSTEGLDVELLSKSMRVSLDIYGWDLDVMAVEIAAEYARLRSTQDET
jgi:hypothetical protein